MKHSFRFIYIIAIVVTIMIVVTMGLFVMKNSVEFTSTVNLSEYDIGEFNSLWKGFEGARKGTALRGLLTRLKTNATENKNNPEMLIDVANNTTQGSDFKVVKSTTKNPNIQGFEQAANELVVKHTYTVELIYNEEKELLIGILIKNDRNDKFEFTPDES